MNIVKRSIRSFDDKASHQLYSHSPARSNFMVRKALSHKVRGKLTVPVLDPEFRPREVCSGEIEMTNQTYIRNRYVAVTQTQKQQTSLGDEPKLL